LGGTDDVDVSGETAFRLKQFDWWAAPAAGTAVAAGVVDGVIADFPEVHVQEFGMLEPVVAGFPAPNPPWNDSRLLQAVNRLFDRRAAVERLHAGRGLPSALVPWPWTYWALPQDELATLPGFLLDRDAEVAEARLLWEAAGGPAEVTAVFPDIWMPLYPDAGAMVQEFFARIGVSATIAAQTYLEIVTGFMTHTGPLWFGWATPFRTPDPTAMLYGWLHSTSSENYWGLNQPGGMVVEGLDAQLEQMRVTLDREERREMVLDLQRLATQVGCLGTMNLYNYKEQLLSWPYYHGIKPSSYYYGQDLKNHWLDQDDPSFQGRPA
jgi:ABC-type transport system substrate-binding protein